MTSINFNHNVILYILTCIIIIIIILFCVDGVPTLREMISFPMRGGKVNLVEYIAPDYFTFGILLLEDDNGAKICALQKKLMKNATDICRQVLMLWLKGMGKQPVTWSTLVTVLQESDLNQLAQNIADMKLS